MNETNAPFKETLKKVTVCSYHVTYVLQSESTRIKWLWIGVPLQLLKL